jgi:hypothetical protein
MMTRMGVTVVVVSGKEAEPANRTVVIRKIVRKHWKQSCRTPAAPCDLTNEVNVDHGACCLSPSFRGQNPRQAIMIFSHSS